MTTLLIDALIALTKTIDRGLSAVENVRLRSNSPRAVVGAQPTGASSTVAASAGPGGHPSWHPATWSDSELLTAAAELICWLGTHPGVGPKTVEGADNIRCELNNRAAQFRALDN